MRIFGKHSVFVPQETNSLLWYKRVSACVSPNRLSILDLRGYRPRTTESEAVERIRRRKGAVAEGDAHVSGISVPGAAAHHAGSINSCIVI